jgi:hypothetical protein
VRFIQAVARDWLYENERSNPANLSHDVQGNKENGAKTERTAAFREP